MSIRLTDRDIEILIALYGSRFLTTPQIRKLFWSESTGTSGPMKACQRRLQKLADNGLVRRIEQPVKRSESSKPYLYALDEKGAELVAVELDLSHSDIDYSPSSVEDNYPFLDHLIASTDVRIAVKLACENNDYEFVEWVDEKELRSAELKDYVSIQGPDGNQIRSAIVPDARFVIGSGTKSMSFLVEVDRGTVTIRSRWNRGWTRKVLTYRSYYASGAYKKRYGSQRLRLLTVTTTEKRLATLKEATEESGGGSLFWFATHKDATDPTKLLTAKIWHVAGSNERDSLL